ncbi:hypothetical protein Pint_28995 [Pistacia integerrima]|uniref:Uncharacterized protein n=1 Tax=Pistacia integerrima TaxID=434235 RepID=A0ACC0X183_9ROSI|nr:hypothetical protein Pint_28995 [Pistacia integerrima]
MKPKPEQDPVTHLEDDDEPATTAKKKNKKRKRDKPSSLTTMAQEAERVTAKVELIPDQPNKTPPLVGYFPSGFNPQSGDQGEEETTTRVRVYRNMNERKHKTGRLELVVSPAESSVEFVGTSYAGEAMAPQFCQYALGVLDKESQTLKIVPIASNKIFRLEPRVGTSDIAEKEEANVTEEQQADMKAMLDTRYGTKKFLRKSKKLHDLQKENDLESQKDLAKKIKSVKINKGALESAIVDTVLNIPPYDSSATIPELAYPLDKIILKGEWDFLYDIYELLQVGQEVEGSAYPSFVCNRIQKLRELEKDEEKRVRACIFSYITHLVKFKDQHSMDASASAKNHRIPSILRQKFLSSFSNPESKRLPEDKIHLLISYVLVLTLHADNFQTNPADIAKDLRMSEVSLRYHYEKLGCKLKREKNELLATLSVPLQFPKPRRRR